MSDDNTIEGFFCPTKILTREPASQAKIKGKRSGKKLEPEKLFDWIAPEYDRIERVMDPARTTVHSIILDIISALDPPPSRILDLGCGTGYLTQQILELLPDCHVFAVDGSLPMLKVARENLDEFLDRVTLAKADFRDPWESILDGSIDVVVHYSALRYIPQHSQKEVLARIWDILGKGGWFIHGDHVEMHFPSTLDAIAQRIAETYRNALKGDLELDSNAHEKLERLIEEKKLNENCFKATPDQHIAWLIEAGFKSAARIYQDWNVALYVAQKAE